jgi:hypothetical protein
VPRAAVSDVSVTEYVMLMFMLPANGIRRLAVMMSCAAKLELPPPYM